MSQLMSRRPRMQERGLPKYKEHSVRPITDVRALSGPQPFAAQFMTTMAEVANRGASITPPSEEYDHQLQRTPVPTNATPTYIVTPGNPGDNVEGPGV